MLKPLNRKAITLGVIKKRECLFFVSELMGGIEIEKTYNST